MRSEDVARLQWINGSPHTSWKFCVTSLWALSTRLNYKISVFHTLRSVSWLGVQTGAVTFICLDQQESWSPWTQKENEVEMSRDFLNAETFHEKFVLPHKKLEFVVSTPHE